MKKFVATVALGATALATLSSSSLAQSTPPSPRPGGPLAAADRNGDGVVTRDEAAVEADQRFDAMDADHNGRIERAERRAYREAHRPMRRHAGGQGADAPPPPPAAGDMPPPAEEADHRGPRKERALGKAQFRDRALAMFDRTDTNHDGRIDAQERAAARMLMRVRMIGENGDRRGPPPPLENR